jgi:hypothetical protein
MMWDANAMNEDQLLEKLRRIEALYVSTGSEGERLAAAAARDRMIQRLREVEASDPPIEYKFTLADAWENRLFRALCRRYELQPFRYARQRYTTVMIRVSSRFVDQTLWPEFQALAATLSEHLEEVTTRVIKEVLQTDDAEAEVRGELPAGR